MSGSPRVKFTSNENKHHLMAPIFQKLASTQTCLLICIEEHILDNVVTDHSLELGTSVYAFQQHRKQS